MSEVTELTNEQLAREICAVLYLHYGAQHIVVSPLLEKPSREVVEKVLRRLSTQGAGPFRSIPLTKGQFAIVDAADFEGLNRWKWHAWFNKTGNTWYARRSVTNGGKRVILMHRQIIEAETGSLVDHRDHNGLNNCRSNLRKATRAQNQHNRDVQRNNACGFKGVSWSKRRKMWIAQIEVNGHKIPLGYFANKDDAAKAYRDKAEEMHGEFFLAPSDPPTEIQQARNELLERFATVFERVGMSEMAAEVRAEIPHEHGREVKR